MKNQINLVLADGQEVFRKSLSLLLNSLPDFKVVYEASDGRDVLNFLKQDVADVVLLNAHMPVMNGKTTLEIIRNRFPNVKVIVLNFDSDTDMCTDFMIRGANSYLGKNVCVNTLHKAISTVYLEGYFFNKDVSMEMLDSLKNKMSATVDEVSFNERETEIIVRICEGQTNKQIAAGLNIASSTVDFHRTKIYSKTNCNNIASLIKYAVKKGIVSLS